MSNVQALKDFLATKEVGDTVEIATSQYADNTTAPGHRFDFYSTASAVRALVEAGYIVGENLWRYYEVEIVKLPLPDCFESMHDVLRAYRACHDGPERRAMTTAFRKFVSDAATAGDLMQLLRAIDAAV